MRALIVAAALMVAMTAPASSGMRDSIEMIYIDMIRSGLVDRFEYDDGAVSKEIKRHSFVRGVDKGIFFEWCFHHASMAKDHDDDTAVQRRIRVFSRRVSYNAMFYQWVEHRDQEAPSLSKITDERFEAARTVIEMKLNGVFDSFADRGLCRAFTRIAVGSYKR